MLVPAGLVTVTSTVPSASKLAGCVRLGNVPTRNLLSVAGRKPPSGKCQQAIVRAPLAHRIARQPPEILYVIGRDDIPKEMADRPAIGNVSVELTAAREDLFE